MLPGLGTRDPGLRTQGAKYDFARSPYPKSEKRKAKNVNAEPDFRSPISIAHRIRFAISDFRFFVQTSPEPRVLSPEVQVVSS